ncbi:cysteine hydrolase family protein [Streptococcus ictaluri]|nr:cysteine hydrolase family protein [Streptococcus ictaluri]
MIDVQNGLVNSQPYLIDNCLALWQEAIGTARQKSIEVIYIRHHDEELPLNSKEWEIPANLSPLDGERIFEKRFNSIFKETDLHCYLKEKGIKKLCLMGMLTNYCMDTSIKVAFELGYEVFVLENGTTTFDDDNIPASLLVDYHERIWADRFAQVDDLEMMLQEE